MFNLKLTENFYMTRNFLDFLLLWPFFSSVSHSVVRCNCKKQKKQTKQKKINNEQLVTFTLCDLNHGASVAKTKQTKLKMAYQEIQHIEQNTYSLD